MTNQEMIKKLDEVMQALGARANEPDQSAVLATIKERCLEYYSKNTDLRAENEGLRNQLAEAYKIGAEAQGELKACREKLECYEKAGTQAKPARA